MKIKIECGIQCKPLYAVENSVAIWRNCRFFAIFTFACATAAPWRGCGAENTSDFTENIRNFSLKVIKFKTDEIILRNIFLSF